MLRRFVLLSNHHHLHHHHFHHQRGGFYHHLNNYSLILGGASNNTNHHTNNNNSSSAGVNIIRVSENRGYHTTNNNCVNQNSEKDDDLIHQVLRDPTTSDSIKDFVLETVSIVERSRKKKKNKTSSTTSGGAGGGGGNESDSKNVEYLEAVNKYQKDTTQKEPMILFNSQETIDNVFRKYLKSPNSTKLSKILSFFVKYPDVARTGEFYSRFLNAIGMNLQLCKKMPIETIDKIFEKIPAIDVTPDTYRALILCYSNKGKMDAIPGLLDKMDTLSKKGFISIALSAKEIKRNRKNLGATTNTANNATTNISEKKSNVITDLESDIEAQRRMELRAAKEKKNIEYLKLRCTFESFVHNFDLTAVERLIVMKRNEWIANHKHTKVYTRMLCDSIEFYLFNQKFREAKQLINLIYKYELPRTRGSGRVAKPIKLEEDGGQLLIMSDKPASLNDSDRFFNLLLRFYKDSKRKYLCSESKRMALYKQYDVKVDGKMHPINEPMDLPREVLSTNKLFELTIAEMKRNRVPFTKNIYNTLHSYYFRKKNYERCIFFFEDCLRHGIIPCKISFIYAEESYLIVGDVKKAIQCHQMRDLHYRNTEISPAIKKLGPTAILDYLYNFENKKSVKGIEMKLRSEHAGKKKESDHEDEEDSLTSEELSPNNQNKQHFKKKQVYSLTDLYLKLSDAAKNQEE